MGFKITNIFSGLLLEDIDDKLTNGTLTSEEVSQKIQIICEKGNNQLKKDILNRVTNLSEESINILVSSIEFINYKGFGGGVLNTCFGYIDMLYESTENHLISELIKFDVNSVNIRSIYNDLFEKNLRESSIKIIAENFLQSDNITVLIWCLCEEKLKNYQKLFLEKLSEVGTIDSLFLVLRNSSFLEKKEIEFILSEFGRKYAKNVLCRLIERNFIGSEYFGYIMNLLNSIDNLNLEDIKNIPASRLDSYGRHILTDLYCKLGTSESILNYFEIYNSCLDEIDIKLIVKKLCELHDKISLIALSRYEIVKPYYDDIFESLSQIENILYDDICEINFSILSKDNKDEYVNIVCKDPCTSYLCGFASINKTYLEKNHIDKVVATLCERLDGECIYKFAKEIDKLSPGNISDLTKALSKTNSAKYIYKFAKNIKNISRDDISVLANAIYKSDDIKYIYLFLKNVSNIKKEDKKLLRSKILNSRNMKFIYLTALYIDEKLIKKLFHDEQTMYACMIKTNLFSNEELLEASKKVFSRKIDVSLVELNAQIKAEEISCKKKKKTINDDLNKRGSKKGNK